jgi:hypothetical protein
VLISAGGPVSRNALRSASGNAAPAARWQRPSLVAIQSAAGNSAVYSPWSSW